MSSRTPSDYSDFNYAFCRGREWKRPSRSTILGGPCVTNTPDAIWWLYTPHESGRPARDFDPSQACMPAVYWKPWEKPSPCLPIDHVIERLIKARYPNFGKLNSNKTKRGRGIPTVYDVRKIIPKEELRELGINNGGYLPINCPYSYVRGEISEAVGLAYDDKISGEKYRGSAPSRAEALKDAVSALNKALDAMDYAVSSVKKANLSAKNLKYSLHDHAFRNDDIEIRVEDGIHSARQAIAIAIGDMSAKEGVISEAGRREDIWWTSFIKSCAVIWTNITGVQPNNGHAEFIRFLDAVNESLGGEPIEFRDKVKSVIKRVNGDGDRPGMALYDRFDAEAKGLLPPEEIPELSTKSLLDILFSDKRTIKELMVDASNSSITGDWMAIHVLEARIVTLDEESRKAITKLMGDLGL